MAWRQGRVEGEPDLPERCFQGDLVVESIKVDLTGGLLEDGGGWFGHARLLGYGMEGGGFAASPRGADTPRAMGTESTGRTAADDLAGRRLGGYRLLRLLGSGGMADVYLAEQTSLGRHVAVKVLRPETLRHPGAVERFEQEARAAAALVHGHIVQVHEVACLDGLHFLAEEYVAGPSLKDWLDRRGPLDAAQALTVLAQVGSALVRAAQQGIVHRDIKPENLLVTPTGDVKVADFGLARLTSDDLALTRDGMTLGTPLYISPEQGEGRTVDARSDLYSLGATVYHLLAGRPPFSGNSVVAVIMAHIKEPLPKLSGLRPELSAGLCGIIERLLAKEPAHRFASPQELLQAVGDLERQLGLSHRHGESPLAWDGADSSLFKPVPPAARTGADAATVPARAHGITTRLHEATVQLETVNEQARERLVERRRFWMLVAAGAAGAVAAGFVAGRFKPKRSTLFRPRSER